MEWTSEKINKNGNEICMENRKKEEEILNRPYIGNTIKHSIQENIFIDNKR